MIFLIAVIGGILAGFLFKGKPGNLYDVKIHHPWLLLAFFLLDALLNSRFGMLLPNTERLMVAVLLSIQYISLFTLVIINRKRWPLLFIGLGELANYLVIMANGGRMPVDVTRLPDSSRLSSLLEGRVPHYGAVNAATRLPFLGDILYLPFPSPALLSAGDLIIWAGLFLLMFHAMLAPPNQLNMETEEEPRS